MTTDTARTAEATRIVRAAGALALDYFDRLAELTITSKGVQDMVSEADVAVEQLIRSELERSFPEDGFLGEESGASGLDGTAGAWVVDPIDGTQPFLSGLRTWCVSIAYVRDGRVQLGLVFNPAADELFLGGVGQPATLNGRPIAPSSATSVAEGLTFLGCSARVGPEDVVPVLDRLMRAHGMFVRIGSGALGLCDVACGRLVGYLEPHINAWDCLGAVGVLEAAGARVSDYLDAQSLLTGRWIVAATPAVYDELFAILRPAA